MGSTEFEIDATVAMSQAKSTAQTYFKDAQDILYEWNEEENTRDAIELAKVMAQDFHTSIMCMKMQEIRDAIRDRKIYDS